MSLPVSYQLLTVAFHVKLCALLGKDCTMSSGLGFEYVALVPCDCCGVIFDAGGDVVAVDIPGTPLRLLVIGDFCPVCSSVLRSDIEAIMKDFQPTPPKRR